MIRKDTNKLISFKFFSLADFYKTVSEKIGSTKESTKKLSMVKGGSPRSFYGASYSQIQERMYSWVEGVSMLKNLASVELTTTKQWVKTWNEDDGDDMDMERYYNDMPFLQKRVKSLGVKSRGNRIQKIIVNLTENANIGASEMLWKTYTAVKLCDEFESQGIRCEVVAVEACAGVDDDNRSLLAEIPIKSADEPINTSLLCTVLSPWFFRHWIFQLETTQVKNVDSSLGSARSLTTNDIPDLENCIVINKGMALSKTSANNFLKGVTV